MRFEPHKNEALLYQHSGFIRLQEQPHFAIIWRLCFASFVISSPLLVLWELSSSLVLVVVSLLHYNVDDELRIKTTIFPFSPSSVGIFTFFQFCICTGTNVHVVKTIHLIYYHFSLLPLSFTCQLHYYLIVWRTYFTCQPNIRLPWTKWRDEIMQIVYKIYYRFKFATASINSIPTKHCGMAPHKQIVFERACNTLLPFSSCSILPFCRDLL